MRRSRHRRLPASDIPDGGSRDQPGCSPPHPQRVTNRRHRAAAFEEKLRGCVITPSDADYERARHVWNGHIDRRPALIVRCRGVADVIDAVNFAREHALLVAVRGGAHNVAGHATCDGGTVIDLSGMAGVDVDPGAGTARAYGGALWRDFDREAQAFGLATTGGTVSNTGVVGLTLGGGLGWLMGKHGLSVDNLLSACVVTPAGRAVRASASENADLYWGLRGGGGNFGVVTSMDFQLHPVGPLVLGGPIFILAARRGKSCASIGISRRTCPTRRKRSLASFRSPMAHPWWD